jgi:hypothetical protein
VIQFYFFTVLELLEWNRVIVSYNETKVTNCNLVRYLLSIIHLSYVV